ALRTSYPSIPQELLDFYAQVGEGRIGTSHYSIHSPIEPSEIYDAETARDLGSLLIVGDDFNGNCDAYKPDAGWQFGTIGSNCKFTVSDFAGIVDWLLFLLGDFE